MAKKNTPEASQEIPASLEVNSKIDAIKQLIFGDNIQAYDSEFEALKEDIKKKKEALESLIDEVREELLKNIDNLGTDINIRITELESSLEDKMDNLDDKKLDRKILGDLLMKLGEKISQ